MKMNKIVTRIKNEFNKTPDLDIKEIRVNPFKVVYVVFLETVCSSDKVNDYILKNLTRYNKKNNLNSNVPGPNTIIVKNDDEIEFYLTNGFAIIINNDQVLAIEVKGDLNRSIATSNREPALIGPQDAFNENYQINIGLIKRRIKSNMMKTEEMVIGRVTKTKIGINYLENVADLRNVEYIKEKLQNIDIDGIIDASKIMNFIEDEDKCVFPTIKRTERPDLASDALLEGKIVILIDTTPYALILPTFLIDLINPINDNYMKSKNMTFIKMLRIACFIISMSAPAVFIAIMNYNQETIPTSLLINFSEQRAGVPFPSIVEMLIMLLICDLLRESDLRFPSNFGSTISILGALIIGEAAVNAGIVSPIMIIVASLTFISSLVFPELEVDNGLRHYRYLFLFIASFLGLYGIFIATTLFLVKMISVKSLGASYLAPLAPFNKNYFFKTFLKRKDIKNTKRSTLITKKNMTKGKF